MDEFLEGLRKTNEQAVRKRLNPDIEEWKKGQKDTIKFRLKSLPDELKWMARCGFLYATRSYGFWGLETYNVPNAVEETRKLIQEFCDPYNVEVVDLEIKREAYINVTLRFRQN